MHIQSNQTHTGHWETIISLPTKLTTPNHIGDVVNIPLRSEWYDSIFQTMI